jgi:hypothetical protein
VNAVHKGFATRLIPLRRLHDAALAQVGAVCGGRLLWKVANRHQGSIDRRLGIRSDVGESIRSGIDRMRIGGRIRHDRHIG